MERQVGSANAVCRVTDNTFAKHRHWLSASGTYVQRLPDVTEAAAPHHRVQMIICYTVMVNVHECNVGGQDSFGKHLYVVTWSAAVTIRCAGQCSVDTSSFR